MEGAADIRYLIKGTCYFVVFPLLFSIKVSYERFFQRAVTFGRPLFCGVWNFSACFLPGTCHGKHVFRIKYI